MGSVIGARPVKQPTVRFPIEPAVVERAVGEADEPAFVRPAAREQGVARLAGVEPRCRFHRGRIAAGDLLVRQGRVEIIPYARFQAV